MSLNIPLHENYLELLEHTLKWKIPEVTLISWHCDLQ